MRISLSSALAAVTALSLAALSVPLAATARADVPVGGLTVSVSPPATSVGLPVVINAAFSSPDAASSGGTFVFTANGSTISTQAAAVGQTAAAFTYTPTVAGTVTLGASYAGAAGASFSGSQPVSVDLAPTITAVSAPSSARAGSTLSFSASVATSGSVPAMGTVTFTVDGTRLAPVTLTSGKAAATYPIPAGPNRSFQVIADYSGDGGHAASRGTDTVAVNAGSAVSVTVPTTAPAGSPVTVIVEVSPQASATGAVTLTANGVQVGSPTALVNGLASFQWTPQASGVVTLRASFPGNAAIPASYEDDVVLVTAPAQSDSISATFNGAPWSSPQLGNGQSAAVVFSSASGAAVTVSASGPCSLTGQVVRAAAGSGVCSLLASSPGSASLAAKQSTFTLSLVPAAPTASWAQGKSIAKGRSVRLAPSGALASSGQPLSFKVVSGASRCQVAFGSAVLLKGKAKGVCKVRATAAPVAGQFLGYSATRTFRVR